MWSTNKGPEENLVDNSDGNSDRAPFEGGNEDIPIKAKSRRRSTKMTKEVAIEEMSATASESKGLEDSQSGSMPNELQGLDKKKEEIPSMSAA